MTNTLAVRIAALMGLLAVGLGAFGAHGLQKLLEQSGRVETWHTAVFYHLVHAVMLFVLAGQTPLRRGPWWSFLIGVLIFSGTLYVLALTNIRWLSAITPLGGVSLMVGWLWLIISPQPRIANRR